MNESTKQRLRRARRARAKIKQLGVHRLSVHRSSNHTYAQVFAPEGQVVATASTVGKGVLADGEYGGNVAAAKKVGEAIAKAPWKRASSPWRSIARVSFTTGVSRQLPTRHAKPA